jgi:hypothetical protein
MCGKNLVLLPALCLAALPGAAAAEGLDGGLHFKRDSVSQGRSETGGQSYGDRNRGGPRGFYSYPRHRHIDGGSGGNLDRRHPTGGSASTSSYCDNCHGSAYYGRNYGAPYFGGGYYDRGVYYRERRD